MVGTRLTLQRLERLCIQYQDQITKGPSYHVRNLLMGHVEYIPWYSAYVVLFCRKLLLLKTHTSLPILLFPSSTESNKPHSMPQLYSRVERFTIHLLASRLELSLLKTWAIVNAQAETGDVEIEKDESTRRSSFGLSPLHWWYAQNLSCLQNYTTLVQTTMTNWLLCEQAHVLCSK